MNEVRIIAGKFRGRAIRFPDAMDLRPTGQRVRETLFNWLAPMIHGASCWDVFAGSGALGLEAYSRGASSVLLTEANPQVCKQLQHTIAQFNAQSDIRLLAGSCWDLWDSITGPFDVIFLDPPFECDWIAACLTEIAQRNLLTKDGFVYAESRKIPDINSIYWNVYRQKKAGHVLYSLFQKHQT